MGQMKSGFWRNMVVGILVHLYYRLLMFVEPENKVVYLLITRDTLENFSGLGKFTLFPQMIFPFLFNQQGRVKVHFFFISLICHFF